MNNQHLSYRSGNPVLTSKAFSIKSDYSEKMTIEGTVNKTFLLLFLVMGSGYFAWTNLYTSLYLLLPATILSLVFMILVFGFNSKPRLCKWVIISGSFNNFRNVLTS